jgi:hypothetical protein
MTQRSPLSIKARRYLTPLRHSARTLLLIPFFLTACGGGNDSSQPVSKTAAVSAAASAPAAQSSAAAESTQMTPWVTDASASHKAATPAPALPANMAKESTDTAGRMMLGASPAITVGGLTPSAGIAGEVVSIAGTGFTSATRVIWLGGVMMSHYVSSTQFLVLLPQTNSAQDLTGPLTFIREDNAQAASASALTVQAVPMPSGLAVSSAREGDAVVMNGKFLTPQLIRSMAIGDLEFLPTSANGAGTQIVFTVPKGAASGSVVLLDYKGHRIPAGTLTVIPSSPSIDFSSVQLSQGPLYTISGPVVDKNIRLVGQRDLLVRLRLNPAASLGQIKPEVLLAYGNDTQAMQVVQMAGPATLGTTAVAENDMSNSYTYTIPGSAVDKGFRLSVKASDARYPDATRIFNYTPPAGALGGGTYIRVHLVPTVRPDGTRAKIDPEHFRRELMAVYPLSAVDVVVEPDFPWAVSNTISQDNILDLLSGMATLRSRSQPKNYDFYVGVMACACSSVATLYGRTAVVADEWYGTNANAVTEVAMHELGHNFGRVHSWDDAQSPHKNGGVIGSGPWLPEVSGGNYTLSFVDPATRYDIMSYDVPDAISSYTFAGAYDYLQGNLPLSAKPRLLLSGTPAGPALFISGRIDTGAGKVRLHDPANVSATPDTVALAPDAATGSDDYVLEIRTATGSYRYPLSLKTIVSERSTQSIASFELNIAPVADIERIRILRGSAVLLERAGLVAH